LRTEPDPTDRPAAVGTNVSQREAMIGSFRRTPRFREIRAFAMKTQRLSRSVRERKAAVEKTIIIKLVKDEVQIFFLFLLLELRRLGGRSIREFSGRELGLSRGSWLHGTFGFRVLQ